MKATSIFLSSALVVVMVCVMVSSGFANVWIDENFDGTSIFVQGDGKGATVSPPDATLDIYDGDGSIASPVGNVLTQTGAKVTSKFLDGTGCYQIESGETITVVDPYDNPGNGNFVILQFGVNVDPIPSAGTVGEMRYNWDTDTGVGASPDHSFYVKFVSDGSKVDIIAGEDLFNATPSEATIGTLNSGSEWDFVTMVMQNGTGSQTYTHALLPGGALTLNAGVTFFCSSTTAGHFVAFGSDNGAAKKGTSWNISATGGTLYVDTLYWEGGMDVDSGAVSINIRPFNYSGSPSSVQEWSLFE